MPPWHEVDAARRRAVAQAAERERGEAVAAAEPCILPGSRDSLVVGTLPFQYYSTSMLTIRTRRYRKEEMLVESRRDPVQIRPLEFPNVSSNGRSMETAVAGKERARMRNKFEDYGGLLMACKKASINARKSQQSASQVTRRIY